MRLRISTIIPVYNAAPYLAEAIESALGQSVPPDQVIVVDDGSTDASAQVAQRFDEVRYLYQENAGISAARNRGIQEARGEVLAFLDADDVWLPNKLETQLGALQTNPAAQMAFGYVQEFISPELPAEIQRALRCESEPKAGVLPSALMISREAFFRVGWFEPQWHVGEFANWMLRAHEVGLEKMMLPEVLVRRRVHTTNNGVRQRQKFNDYARMIKASLDRRRAAGQEG